MKTSKINITEDLTSHRVIISSTRDGMNVMRQFILDAQVKAPGKHLKTKPYRPQIHKRKF